MNYKICSHVVTCSHTFENFIQMQIHNTIVLVYTILMCVYFYIYIYLLLNYKYKKEALNTNQGGFFVVTLPDYNLTT